MRPCHPKTAVSLSESPFHLLAIYLMINSYLVMTFGWVNLFSVRFVTSYILAFLSVFGCWCMESTVLLLVLLLARFINFSNS